MAIKNIKNVPYVIFSRGAVKEVAGLVNALRKERYAVFVIDHYFKNKNSENLLGISYNDIVFFLDTTEEPKTGVVDDYVRSIRNRNQSSPSVIIGMGGGSAMDVAKAVSIMLTNPGSSSQYQGWDLVKYMPIYKIAIPTISGTGAEVSKTAVLMGPEKKQGINSEYALFDQIVLDPDLLETVPSEQKFFTGMDCYIHCIESLRGTFKNELGVAYAEKGLGLCRDVFLGNGNNADLMVASMFGGYSIVYSEVGICHALSYGLSYALGVHHGEAISIVFDYLSDYYSDDVVEFRKILSRYGIILRRNLVKGIDMKTLEKMTDLTLLMEKPLHNALGRDWQKIFTREKIHEVYEKM